MQTHCDRTADAEAYVLGELSGDELAEFTRHLRTCAICTEEVELVESAADAVSLLASRPPNRTTAPVIERSNSAFKNGPLPTPKPRLRAIAGGGGEPEAPKRSRRGPGFLSRKVPNRVVWAVAALAVNGVITAILTRESNSISYVRAEATWSERGAIVAIRGTEGELGVAGMPAAPHGYVYEIWVLNPGTSQLEPTGAYVRPDARGDAEVAIPGDMTKLVAMAVYEEPSSGPQLNSQNPVVAADLIPATDGTS